MEDLQDKDKTIAILRHQYAYQLKLNEILTMELGVLGCEIEDLKRKYNLPENDMSETEFDF